MVSSESTAIYEKSCNALLAEVLTPATPKTPLVSTNTTPMTPMVSLESKRHHWCQDKNLNMTGLDSFESSMSSDTFRGVLSIIGVIGVIDVENSMTPMMLVKVDR